MYGDAYFANYQRLADTDIGRRLTAARVAMLHRHWDADPAHVVDIGIGAGTFVEAAGCMGYDINPAGIAWLKERGAFRDPYAREVDGACCWDSLEHMPDPAAFLARIRWRLLVSLPIFRDAEHALRSKHYKPGEHLWYWTERGLLWFMAMHGWDLVESNDNETWIGREDIRSYAFARVRG